MVLLATALPLDMVEVPETVQISGFLTQNSAGKNSEFLDGLQSQCKSIPKNSTFLK